MLILLRIILFIVCITVAGFAASEPAIQSLPSPQPVLALENTYVKIESDSTSASTNFSILRTAEKIYQHLNEEYHSLLNWKTFQRPRPAFAPRYDRTGHFGRWINDPNDESCYNTRAVVLIRDSKGRVVFSESNKCSVQTGLWKDDYTGEVFTNREDIQIDHFVPLKNAYISGAHRWSFKARCLYSNFLGNKFHLKAVNATENMKKGDRSPLQYMPPNPRYACQYLKNWLAVKFLWGLQMQDDEALAISRLIADHNCKTADFRMSSREIAKQNKFVNDNIELCEKIDPATKK